MPTELLTVPEVARELRVSETAVYRMIGAGEMPHTVIGVRRYVVTRDQLDAYIAAAGVDPGELEAQAAAIRAARERAAAVDAGATPRRGRVPSDTPARPRRQPA